MKKIFSIPMFLIVFLVSANLVWGQAASKALGLDVPKITKNNLKITKLNISSVEIQEDNTVKVDGTFEIQNYADTETSELYFSKMLGIKGGQYFLQYPLQQDTRSERFVIPAKQTITKPFTLSQKDMAQFADLGVEVRLFDAYDRKISAKAVSIETFNIKSPYAIATSTMVFILNEEQITSEQLMVYSPEKETLQIKASAITNSEDIQIDDATLKIYQDTYYQNPIHTIDAELLEDEFIFTIPKDLKPGRYAFETSFNSNDSNIFIPRVYGEFVVNGNLNKITEVSFEKKNKTMSKITATVQGSSIYTDATSTVQYMFDTEFILYDKEGQEIWKTIKNQNNAQFFRNIEVEIDTEIKIKNISKIKVNLINEGGVFDSFEKEVIYEEEMNILVLVLSMFVLLIGVILFKKYILKNKNIVVCFLFLLCVLGLLISSEASSIIPTPVQEIGFITWDDEPDSNPTACGGTFGCDTGLSGIIYQQMKIDLDIDLFAKGSDVLSMFHTNFYFQEPTFVEQDPQHCYNPGETVPLFFSYSGASLNSLYVHLYVRDNTWFSNLIPNLIYPGDVNDDEAFSWNHYNYDRYNWEKTDLSIWYNYIQSIENQSNLDFVATSMTDDQRKLLNINHKLVSFVRNFFSPTHASPETIYLINKTSETYQKTFIAPENPGLYDFILDMQYTPMNGTGSTTARYISRHRISVCDRTHDADFTMPGWQYVDPQGTVRDEIGVEMPGYTVYSPSPSYITHKYLWPNVYSGTPPQIYGFNNVPDPKLSFVTIANYCGYKNPASTWNNNWVNFYTSIKDTILNSKAGYDAMSSFSPKSGFTRFAVFAYKPYPLTGTFQYYQTTSTSTNPTSSNTYYDWYVHNENGNLKFIDLDDVKTAFNNVLDFNEYSSIPRYTLGEMLSNQFFNFSNWFDASNNTGNTYIVKENLKAGSFNAETTCSIYEDFCPDVPGIQYIHSASSKLNLYNLVNGQRIFATSTAWNANQTQAQAMCSVIPVSPPVTVSCEVLSPADIQDRTPGANITFAATAGNLDSNFPTTYTWTNATAQADTSTAIVSYLTTGIKSDVIVEVSNNGSTASTTCPVEIVPETLVLSCEGSPVSYTLQSGETSRNFLFTYSANQTISSQTWKDGNITKSTNPSYSETFFIPDMYQRTVFATSTTGAAASASCSVSLLPDGSVTLNPNVSTFEFNPSIITSPVTECPLFLDVSDVTSCTLTNTATGAQTVFATTSPNSILINGQDINLGTWNLTCTGVGINAQPQELGVQKCIGNSAYRES